VAGLFDGKVALVTGGASGIGEATAQRLAAEGASVIVADVNADGAQQVAGSIGGAAIALDVRRVDAWEAALADVVATKGRLDILHLNAGVMTKPVSHNLMDDVVPWLVPESFEKVCAVNIDGVANGIMAAIPHLTTQGGGDIVVTASIAGLAPFSPDPFYSMSKFAVVGLASSLGPVLEPRGIRINAICPGGIATPLVPPDLRERGGFSPPSYIAGAVVGALTSGRTGEIWVAWGEGHDPWVYEFPSPRR
jgi:NAD(P)-dependent dehydrogenase (short-subunit alcohol dehydrogenase family)